ncbi:MAG: tetratricopeptide repeat protein [Bacteroidetes bacterium]|nr:tetratricopeptide repeat protein [Bacteroidota bacterium]
MRKIQACLFVYAFVSCLSGSIGFTTSAQNRLIDSLLHVLPSQSGKDRAKTLIELCVEFHFTNADSAKLFGLEALKMAEDLQSIELEVDALHNLGVANEAQGNYAEALKLEMKALDIRKQIGDELKTANTLNNIGIIYDEQGDYQRALEYYYNARRIYEKVKDKAKIAMVLTNIGIVLKAQGEYRKVVGYYQQAMNIYHDLGKKFGEAACHANLGAVYYNLAIYDSAIYYSLMAEKEFTEQNNQQFLPTTLVNAGIAFAKLNQTEKAKSYLLRAKQLDESFDNKKDLAIVLTHLAGIYLREGDFAKAQAAATTALTIATKINAQQEILEARLALSGIYESKKDFASAYKEYKDYVAVKDDLFQQEKSRQITEIQAKYETEKKENEIKFLKQDNDLKDARLNQNRLLIISLGGVLLGGLALGFMYRTRIQLKQNAELEATRASLRESQLQAVISSQEEERKRFAADLHDGLGQMISAVRLGLSKENVEKNSVNYALSLLNDMNAEIRDIAFNLMPQVLMKSGLDEALKEFATRINRSGGVTISVQTYDLNHDLTSEHRIALYRISQEWVNNVIKYSGATAISIQVVQHPQELVLTIEDNGRGFNSARLMQSEGNGWKNINSRLHLIKGELEIDSQEGRTGTTLVITVSDHK